MPQITALECQYLVNSFLDKHISEYTEREIRYIRKNTTALLQKSTNNFLGDVLRQIYDELGLLPENINMYSGFISLLEENFDINRNIVEVAGGIIPSLGKKISLRQKTGTITVYDPRIILPTTKTDNLILKRQMFSKNTPIPNADMLIGFMPCNATIPIIESAFINNIDFMIALCEGGSRIGYEWLETEDEWISYVMYLAKNCIEKQNLGELGIASLEQYGNPYPVIYNKKRQSKN